MNGVRIHIVLALSTSKYEDHRQGSGMPLDRSLLNSHLMELGLVKELGNVASDGMGMRNFCPQKDAAKSCFSPMRINIACFSLGAGHR